MKPSVTKLIDMLDKPGLLKWANRIGLQGINIDDYRSDSKNSGSNIHSVVESFTKYGLLSNDEGLNQKMQKFFSDKEILEMEKDIETDFFIGRFDIKLKWHGFIFICDYKSNSNVYFETKLQLAAYKMGTECDHLGIIHLPEFFLRPVDLDLGLYSQLLINLSSVYRLKEKIENSK